MANGNVTLTANTWTQIADGGLSAASWQVKAGSGVYVAATAADSASTGDHTAWPVYKGEV